MVEHLTREQIAALIDEPDALAEGRAHLDACEECAHEFEAMSRTRMALSGLPDLAAPDGAWERIRADLDDRVGGAPSTAERDVVARGSWWRRSQSGAWGAALSAAAVLLLFLGGMGVGRILAPDGSSEPARSEAIAAGETVASGQAAADPSEYGAEHSDEYLRSVADLRELRGGGPTAAEMGRNPALAAERLTRLDALIEASREALREAPADPALNDFLFDVVDERASVAGQLDQSLRQASMEY